MSPSSFRHNFHTIDLACRRRNLGVQGALLLPQASVHLVAGILQAYNPDLYPRHLLRILATAGRTLDCVATQPVVSLENLRVDSLRDHALLKDGHLQALRAVMSSGGTVEDASATSEMLQLEDLGFLERSPLEKKRLFMADPKLLTICEMQPAHDSLRVDNTFF